MKQQICLELSFVDSNIQLLRDELAMLNIAVQAYQNERFADFSTHNVQTACIGNGMCASQEPGNYLPRTFAATDQHRMHCLGDRYQIDSIVFEY